MNAPDKFHAERALGLGGTDAAPALGISKWKTPLQVYLEKRGEAPPIEETEPMRWGKRLEPAVLSAFRDRGFPICPGEFVKSASHPFMVGHLDAILPGKAIVEAKTARGPEGWGEDGSAEAPVDYVVQATHYMAVTGLQLAYLPVLIAGSDFRVIELPFDAELGDMIVAAEAGLWHKIEAGTPPEPRTLADVNALYRHSRSDAIEASEEIAQAWGELVASRKTIADAEEWAAAREKRLKEFMGERDTLTYFGKTIATWRESKPVRAFDSKRFRAENPQLAECYEIERAGSRRFLLKD